MAGLEVVCEFGARLRIQSIRRDDEIVVFGEFAGARDFGLKTQVHAKRAARCCNSMSSFLRAMPEKPWPLDTIRWPR